MTCTTGNLAKAKQMTAFFHEVLKSERHYVSQTLRLLAHIETDRLYADMGYSSLYAYCTQELGLSEQQAYLRINVARTARRHPEIFDKIERGELNMTSVNRMSAAILVVEEPKAMIEEATNLSKRQVEELVAEHMPRPDEPQRTDPHPTSPGRYLMRANISSRAMALIDQARDLGGPTDVAALIEAALETHVEKLLKRKLRTTSVPGRKISTKVKRATWERDEGRCTFCGPDGERCTETRHLQFDHKRPVALGGSAERPEEIRLLCPAHNRLMARRLLDPQMMELYSQGFRPKPRGAVRGDDDPVAIRRGSDADQGERPRQMRAPRETPATAQAT